MAKDGQNKLVDKARILCYSLFIGYRGRMENRTMRYLMPRHAHVGRIAKMKHFDKYYDVRITAIARNFTRVTIELLDGRPLLNDGVCTLRGTHYELMGYSGECGLWIEHARAGANHRLAAALAPRA